MSHTRTAVIYGQPHPSVIWGLKSHHVTYIGWGSEYDYNSYNYIGYGYNPNELNFSYGGYIYLVGGDEWLADRTSDPDEWNAAYADTFEYHLQILYPDTQQPTPYAFRETIWNRPITLFSW